MNQIVDQAERIRRAICAVASDFILASVLCEAGLLPDALIDEKHACRMVRLVELYRADRGQSPLDSDNWREPDPRRKQSDKPQPITARTEAGRLAFRQAVAFALEAEWARKPTVKGRQEPPKHKKTCQKAKPG